MKRLFIYLLVGIPLFSFAQWTPVSVPQNATIASITFTDPLHGIATAYEKILKSNDGGDHWTVVANYPGLVVADAAFPTPDTGFAVGDQGLLLKTTNGGDNWSPMYSPTDGVLRGVYFHDTKNGFICGQWEQIYSTHDGGLTWEMQNYGAYWLRQFSFPTPLIGYCAGDGMNVYKTINGGASWQLLNVGFSENNITDIFFVTPQVGYISGLDGYLGKTSDGGLTWQQLYSGFSDTFEGLWFFDEMNGYAVGWAGRIMRTYDGGATWTQENSGTDSFLRKAFFFNSNKGFICGHEGTILKKGDCLPHADFQPIVTGVSVAFTNLSMNADTCYWEFGDGGNSYLRNPEHTYQMPGNYSVYLKVSNQCGADTLRKMVQICVDPVADFHFEFMYPGISFSDSSLTGSFISRLWDFGDGTFSTEKDPFHDYPYSGDFYPCLTINDSCGTDTHCDTIHYYLPMQLNVNITPSQTDDRTVQFADATDGTTSWKWDFGDGGTSTLKNPIHQYKKYGFYKVCLVAGNQTHSGKSCDSLLLEVNPSQHSTKPVILYPNPSLGWIYLQFFEEIISGEVLVLDLTGKVLMNVHVDNIQPAQTTSLNLSTLQQGVYFIQFKSSELQRIWKLVRQ
jgi:PKD repeat protein